MGPRFLRLSCGDTNPASEHTGLRELPESLMIRTIVFNGDEYSFQAGAGIVADSVPDHEYREVLAKSAILRQALELAEEGL